MGSQSDAICLVGCALGVTPNRLICRLTVDSQPFSALSRHCMRPSSTPCPDRPVILTPVRGLTTYILCGTGEHENEEVCLCKNPCEYPGE